jgi:DNA repair exonuclease SbcCD nuclease subunit
MAPFSVAGLDLDVYGMATSGEGKDVLSGFRAVDGARWRAGLLHASFVLPGKVERDEMLVSAHGIGGSNLHYLALGHWHSRGDYSQGNTAAFFSGPPEPLDMGNGEEGTVVLVDLEEGAPARVQPIPVGRRRMSRLELDAGEIGGPAELYAHLRRLADRELALEVRIKGLWGEEWVVCDWERMEEDLSPLFFHLKLIITPSGLSEHDLEAYAEKTVTGRFIRLAREEMAAREGEELLVAEEALRLGLAHLSGRP